MPLNEACMLARDSSAAEAEAQFPISNGQVEVESNKGVE